MKRFFKGQEAIEFILITALVFFGALFAVILLGDKLSAFFSSGSSLHQTNARKPATITTSDNQKYNPDFEVEAEEPPLSTDTVGDYPAIVDANGNMKVDFDGKQMTLTSDVLADLNTVFETSGSDGATQVMEVLSEMVDQHCDSSQPNCGIQMLFGNGTRTSNVSGTVFQGSASVNSVGLKVNDQVIIIQNDQDISNAQYSPFGGVFTIKGRIDPSTNELVGTVSSVSQAKVSGDFRGVYSNTGITDGYFTSNISSRHQTVTFDWDINF